ncbi:pR23 [rat cytomegalovirus strain Maastricht]|uniref:PR23 n=1 Tax=Rat cytomegalovirus (strain Maastricht) TaxID=79700 RepID=Q9DWH0_RCMVM|nr:pR23 [rat cytomegalovirus strain Maastricht]AAF99119.1 pR23 [rat cytomegalovirus strain Maastricht]
MVCCAENLKFVGSFLPAEPPGGRGPGSGGPDGLVNAVAVAAAAVLGPAVVYPPLAGPPAYGQPPELYVGSTGKFFAYVRLTRSEAVACVARDLEELLREGVTAVYLAVRRPMECRDPVVRELVLCRDCDDVVLWRERHLARRVVLGDGTEVSPCDETFVGFDLHLMERWAVEADVGSMDLLGIVLDPLVVPPLAVLVDGLCRVYVVRGASALSIVADDLYEFVQCGMLRYRRNALFIADPAEAALARRVECPNGFCHHAATNGVPPGSEPVWPKLRRRNGVGDALRRLLGSFRRR